MKLSIIIPIYNAEEYLEQCLESLTLCRIEQTEFILVNDGSTDSSLDICKKYADTDERFVIVDKKNGGVSAARNAGLEASTASYAMFLDADDYIDISSYKFINSSIEGEKVDFTAFSYYTLYNDGKIVEEKFGILPGKGSDRDTARGYMYASSKLNTCWGKIFRMNIIMEHNIRFREDLKIGEDFIFVADYFKHCKTFNISDECILYYRQHGDSAMRKYDLNGRLAYTRELYEYSVAETEAYGDDRLTVDMHQYYLRVLTNLFLEFAKGKSFSEVKAMYKGAFLKEPVIAILSKVSLRNTKPLFKKFECFILKRRMYNMLSIYFRFKATMA